MRDRPTLTLEVQRGRDTKRPTYTVGDLPRTPQSRLVVVKPLTGNRVRIESTTYNVEGENEVPISTTYSDFTYEGNTVKEKLTSIAYIADGSTGTQVLETVNNEEDGYYSQKSIYTTSDSSTYYTESREEKSGSYVVDHKETVDGSTGDVKRIEDYKCEYGTGDEAIRETTTATDYGLGTTRVTQQRSNKEGTSSFKTVKVCDFDDNVLSLENHSLKGGQIRHEIYTYENGEPVSMHLKVETTDGTIIEEKDIPIQ